MEDRINSHPPRFCSRCRIKHPVEGGRYKETGSTRRWVCGECLSRERARAEKERTEADK